MVCRVRADAIIVTVPLVLNGERLLCVFFNGKDGLSHVGIFDSNPRETGPFWIFESYSRRIVPVEAIRDARMRAIEALDELQPQTEREPSFAFAVEVATA